MQIVTFWTAAAAPVAALMAAAFPVPVTAQGVNMKVCNTIMMAKGSLTIMKTTMMPTTKMKPTKQPPTKKLIPKPAMKKIPTMRPARFPTATPTPRPTAALTSIPTGLPTVAPTAHPPKGQSYAPSSIPTRSPTSGPTASPTRAPTASPTQSPMEALTCPNFPGTIVAYGGHLYGLFGTNLSWDVAYGIATTLDCCSAEGHLVTITSLGEKAAVEGLLMMTQTDETAVWLGLFVDANKWIWVAGEGDVDTANIMTYYVNAPAGWAGYAYKETQSQSIVYAFIERHPMIHLPSVVEFDCPQQR